VRASRLLSILILLQLKVRVTADELAREFEVSVRTIYRDIDELSAAGVPVFADRGPGGGFSLLDGYRTDLTGLTLDEAKAMFLIGLDAPADAFGVKDAASRAREKLLAALPKTSGGEAARMGELFHLDPIDWYRAAEAVPHLPAIARALIVGAALDMTYESWSATREWRILPLGLVMKAGAWYLVALPLTAKDDSRETVPITFKVVNVKSLTPRRPTDRAPKDSCSPTGGPPRCNASSPSCGRQRPACAPVRSAQNASPHSAPMRPRRSKPPVRRTPRGGSLLICPSNAWR
jgi:biotin operon repressor